MRVVGLHSLWLFKGHEKGIYREEHVSQSFKRMLGSAMYTGERRRARGIVKQTPGLYTVLCGLEIPKEGSDSEPECVL